MRSALETEADFARRAARGVLEDIKALEGYWPQSKRGSNAQRMLDSMKARATAIQDGLDAIFDADAA